MRSALRSRKLIKAMSFAASGARTHPFGKDPAHQKIIKNALGWLTVPDQIIGVEDDLIAFADRIRGVREFKHLMLCGMGGSSLCPEVLRQTFGHQKAIPSYGS